VFFYFHVRDPKEKATKGGLILTVELKAEKHTLKE
jgi:hypothetical protein